MKTRILSLALALALAFVLTACAAEESPPVDDGSTGLRLAPGLYDLEDGTVQALGTLEYRDLEGGLWTILDGTVTDGGTGDVVAVVGNADEFADELQALEGKTVSAIGTRFEGVSIRMAGPEIIVERIEEISDTPGIAE